MAKKKNLNNTDGVIEKKKVDPSHIDESGHQRMVNRIAALNKYAAQEVKEDAKR